MRRKKKELLYLKKKSESADQTNSTNTGAIINEKKPKKYIDA